MFDFIEISETIYDGLLQPSFKNITTREDANGSGLHRIVKVRSSLSKSYYDIIDCSRKSIQRCVDFPRERSELTCIICGRLVTDYTVHKGTYLPLVGTQGRSTFDIARAPYTVKLFSFLFSIY